MIWYDFHWNNPRNSDVRKVTRREIAGLFPGCEIRLRRITLAPPLGRRLAPLSPRLYRFFERIRPLCSHDLGSIRKAGGDHEQR